MTKIFHLQTIITMMNNQSLKRFILTQLSDGVFLAEVMHFEL